ncbi:MAG: AMP-binding protein [Muribaculaceae bacterium]
MASVADFKREWFNALPYIEAHTSGSTGEPKLIRLPKKDMLASARATNAFFGISASSVLALPLSPDYIAGKMMVVRAIAAGCSLIEMPVSNTITITGHVDLLAIVPSQLPGLLRDTRIADKVSAVIIGGAPLSPAALLSLADSRLVAYASYGMTETCSHVALARIDSSGALRYHAMPGISFDIDSRGCLIINAPMFSFKRLITNDLVADLSDDHLSFVWQGRYDHVINSGGLKISPEALERAISRALPRLQFYITGAPDAKWGQSVALVFEGSADDVNGIKSVIESIVSDRRTLPRQYLAVTHLPRTANGKLLRLSPPQIGK